MALNLKVDVVTSRFDNMLNAMAALDPKVEFKTIVVQMAIRVIQGAANRTYSAGIEQIKAAEAAYSAAREYTTMGGKRYLISGTGSDGHRNRYPDTLWAEIQTFRQQRDAVRLARKLDSRGLGKQSWLQLAEALGGTIQVPGYVKTANYRGQQYPSDVSTEEDSANGSYGLTIVNSSPIVGFAGGRGALLGAMQAEVGYFTQNMAHGFYTTAERMAAKYPGIFVIEGVAA